MVSSITSYKTELNEKFYWLPAKSDLLPMGQLALGYGALATFLYFMDLKWTEAMANIWLPGGFALGLLILLGSRLWPGIALGALAACLIAGLPIAHAAFIAVGQAFGALVAVRIIYGLAPRFDRTLIQLRDYFVFIGPAACCAALITAVVVTLSSYLQNPQLLVHPWETLAIRWAGDIFNITIFGPMLLVFWPSRTADETNHFYSRQLLLFSFIFIVILLFAFFGSTGERFHPLERTYLVFPFVAWATFRFGRRGMVHVSFLISCFALMGAFGSEGGFGADLFERALTRAFGYSMTICVTGMFMAILVDGHKRLEEQNKGVTKRLLRFQRALDHISDGVFMVDKRNFKFVYANESVTSHLGYNPGELIGMSPVDISTQFDRASFSELVEPLLNGEKKALRFESVHRHKDGHSMSVEVVLQCVDFNHKEDGFIAVVRDITDQKNYESSLARAKSDAEQANRAKSLFLANMSHELRTPLNAVIGFSDLILQAGEQLPDATRSEALSFISRAGKHLLVLVTDLLHLSHIETGRLKLRKSSIDLVHITNTCLVMQQAHLKRKNLVFSQSLPGEACLVGDGDRLMEVINNLVSNAIKYTHEGGSIAVVIDKTDETVEFHIKDSGIGIAVADLGRVFNEFERVDKRPNPEIEGIGLGLAISRKIVEMHGGKISVQSEEAVGSTFSFYLPISHLDTR